MIYSYWDIEHNILKLAILGHFLTFYPPKNPKNQNFENPLSFYTYMCTINKDHVMYGVTDKNFVLLGHFIPFQPPDNPENKKLKIEKNSGDIIILHICTWDMEHDRQNFLSFWTVFCPFIALTTQKIKILKNWKKLLEILSYKWQSYDVWLSYGAWWTEFCHFGPFFALLPL